MKLTEKISRKVFLSLIVLVGMTMLATACAGPQAAIVRPTCQEALGQRYHDLTDYEIARLLDDNLVDGCPSCLENCWIPLMEKALDNNRAIPHRHLLQAVKVFNQNQYDRYFHLAIYRYFSDLSRGRGRYRAVDRELLRSYCSKLVQDSFSRQDRKLSQTMELCRRIDPELYRKMFQ